jgi:hypothetical protein
VLCCPVMCHDILSSVLWCPVMCHYMLSSVLCCPVMCHYILSSVLWCPVMCHYILSSVLWCPLQFPHKSDVRFVFPSSCCMGVHALFTLLVFVCAYGCTTHIVFVCCLLRSYFLQTFLSWDLIFYRKRLSFLSSMIWIERWLLILLQLLPWGMVWHKSYLYERRYLI